MTREEVYKVIDGEIEYKRTIWFDYKNNDRSQNNPLEVGEFLTLIDEYLDQAKKVWVTEQKPCVGTLHNLRKIAAIIVDCGEQHGLPTR